MTIQTRYFTKGILLKPTNDETNLVDGNLLVNLTDKKFKVKLDGELKEVLTNNQHQELVNKTINANTNTITNLEVHNFKANVIDTDLNSVSATDDTIPSAKAVKNYVDQQILTEDEASEIVVNPPVNALTNVQAVLENHETRLDTAESELVSLDGRLDIAETDINNIELALANHEADTSAHGVAGAVVGTTDTQTLTNKTITGASIQTPTRLDPKNDTKANLETYALTASNGQLVYATDTKELFTIKDTLLVPAGGGSAGLSSIFQLTGAEQITDWASGNNAAFLGGGTRAGTFVKETAAPLNGNNSYKYTQAAGSLNDYIASPAQVVNRRFRGTQAYLSIPYQYDGLSSDILVVIYDVTNSTVISTSSDFIVANNGSNNTAIIGVNIPNTCASIRVGFQVKAVNSGKILSFDDIELSASLFQSVKTTDYQSITHSAAGNTLLDVGGEVRFNLSNLISTRNDIIKIEDDAANTRTKFVALQDCIVNIAWSANLNTAFNILYITKNGIGIQNSSYTTSASLTTFVSTEIILNKGDYVTVATSTSISNGDPALLQLLAQAQTSAVSVPNQQISSDTIPFVFKSTAIVDSDPIGTFNTYTYSANTNTATISTTAPSQSVSSMNQNGVLVTARPFNAGDTQSNPSRFDIKIGAGLKAKDVALYLGASKTIEAVYDYSIQPNTTTETGTFVKYNEKTGILTINAGVARLATNTARFVDGNSENFSTSGYFVFNASKSASITAIPELAPRIAVIEDVKASNTYPGQLTAGVWQTRELNTLVDPTGIVNSLSSNQFELKAGEYFIEADAPAFNVDRNLIKLRNITDSTDDIFGTSELSGNSAMAVRSPLAGRIVITSTKKFEIQHRCVVTNANGLGIAHGISGVSERFTKVKITKVK